MAQVAATGRNLIRSVIASTPLVDDRIDFELDAFATMISVFGGLEGVLKDLVKIR